MRENNEYGQGPRAQVSRRLYADYVSKELQQYPGLDIREANVFDLVLSSTSAGQRIRGLRLGITLLIFSPVSVSLTKRALDTGEVIPCTQIVICTGTFLGGEIHLGGYLIIDYSYCLASREQVRKHSQLVD